MVIILWRLSEYGYQIKGPVYKGRTQINIKKIQNGRRYERVVYTFYHDCQYIDIKWEGLANKTQFIMKNIKIRWNIFSLD